MDREFARKFLGTRAASLKRCPYCKWPLIKVFKADGIHCNHCDALVVRHDKRGIPYIKCWHCGYEPIWMPQEGLLCPRCKALVF